MDKKLKTEDSEQEHFPKKDQPSKTEFEEYKRFEALAKLVLRPCSAKDG
jgi:hypothetical protein